jgi:hypothetical protein
MPAATTGSFVLVKLPANVFELTEPYFDRKDQHDRVESALIPGETLWMTLDCKGGGTGFVGITDRRIVFQDQSWRKAKNVLVSIPYDRVHAVGISTNQPLIGRSSGTISVQAGEDDWSFEFRNAEKTAVAYKLIMSFVLSRQTNTPDTPVAGVGG